VNRRADDRLDEFAKKARAFGRSPTTPSAVNNKADKSDEGGATKP
jgi:hypothetical protein